MNRILETLRERFRTLDELFRSYSVRERALIGALIAGVVFFAIDNLLIQPTSSKRARVELDSERAEEDIVALEKQIEELSIDSLSDEERRLVEESVLLRKQIEEIQRQLDTTVSSLVPPEAIVGVLEELLAGSKELRLVRLESHPPERVGLSDTSESSDRTTPASVLDAALYRHGLTLEIEGSYQATLDYLDRIERSPWNLIWKRLEYRVDAHPKATITIDLQTISEREEWVGV